MLVVATDVGAGIGHVQGTYLKFYYNVGDVDWIFVTMSECVAFFGLAFVFLKF